VATDADVKDRASDPSSVIYSALREGKEIHVA
jgi:hypothetical protein